MRKKATDKDFAKRIKSLVRKWQLLCKPSSQTVEAVAVETAACVNGKGPFNSRLLEVHPHLKGINSVTPVSPASRPETPCSVRSSVSSPRSTYGTLSLAASAGRRDGTEFSSGVSFSRCVSEIIPATIQSRVVSPLVQMSTVSLQHPSVSLQQHPSAAKQHSAPTTPINSSNLTAVLQGHGGTGNGTDYTTSGKRKHDDESYLPGIKIKIRKKNSGVEGDVQSSDSLSVISPDVWSCMPEMSHRPGANGLLGLHSDHQAPRSILDAQDVVPSKPRRGRPPNSTKARSGLDRTSSVISTHSAASSSKLDPSTMSGRLDLASFSGCTPKVETTAEIIQKLHASGELRLVASDTVKNIVSNRIVKETHSDNESVVPAAAKPRPRKKNSVAMPPTTPDTMTMSQIKNEMVHKFLETSVQPTPVCDRNALNFLRHLDPPPDPEALIDPVESVKTVKPLVMSKCSPNRTAAAKAESDALQDPLSLLPPLDPTQIDWDSLEYEAPDPSSRPPVTDDDVELLHASQLPGINGQFDYEHKWVDWTRTYSVQSYNGELLHLLPYVNITD